jgi:DNA-binding PadR family transcriptional regulator
MEYALLGFLRAGPSYPYEVHQQLERTAILHLVWHLKQRQTYALLERLEEAGFLTSSTEAQERRPPRRMLQLTPQGRAAFQRWVVQPVGHGREFRQEFSVQSHAPALRIEAHPTSEAACCPHCAYPSLRVHSAYTRKPRQSQKRSNA